MDEEYVLLAGSASRALGLAVAEQLRHPLGHSAVITFSEGNLFVQVQENVRGRNVFMIQSVSRPTNDNFMELLFWIDALKRASAASVTVLIPYFSYAKGDKKDEPRVSIRARVCADAIEAAGADRVVTLDLHAPQVQGFFKIPVDDLHAAPVLCAALGALELGDLVVVAPDAGFAKKAGDYAHRLHAPLAVAHKERADHSERAEVISLMGEVTGRTAVLVDDFIISGNTLIDAARVLVTRGATRVIAAVSQALLNAEACARIGDSSIEFLLTTDAVELLPPAGSKIRVVSVAPLFARAITCIANNESISGLFQ
ncbi:MAG: ribose-phosphate diphosphokinase [Candidatus Dormiibacterota bacterium]